MSVKILWSVKVVSKMLGHDIRCILFDLGSTLWERKDRAALQASERASNAVALSALRRFSRSEALFSMNADEPGTVLRATIERRIRAKARENREREPDFALATMEALRELGMKDANRQMGEAIFEALRVRTPDARDLCKDTYATLAALKERGYVLGVVTNRHYGGRPFYEDLQHMGLLDYIDYSNMAISADLGIRKPHPEIFMQTLSALHVAPQEAAMVGDSLRADIVGAKELHMLAIWKPKVSLRVKARTAFSSAHVMQLSHELSGQDEDDMVQVDAGLPDEFLLSYVLDREEHLPPTLRSSMTPDAIIKNLSDLLALFSGVKEQQIS